jgi:hypothetical protein
MPERGVVEVEALPGDPWIARVRYLASDWRQKMPNGDPVVLVRTPRAE